MINKKMAINYVLDSFEEMFSTSTFPTTITTIKNKGIPATNIKEGPNSWNVEMATPGVSKENFDIRIDGNHLIVKYEEKDFDEDEVNNYIKQEFAYSAFTKTFIIPENVNPDSISTEYENGILKIEFPKDDKYLESKIKRLKIK